MDSILSVSYESVARFLEAAEGNYRNAVYITCSTCVYARESGCGDYLFIPGFDCLPVLLPISDAEVFFGYPVDRSECTAIISGTSFCRLYHKWLELNTTCSKTCPFQQILHLMNAPK